MPVGYWPGTYFYWPQTYYYWPDTYYYWPEYGEAEAYGWVSLDGVIFSAS